jgi:hypothetical protein
LFVACVWNHPIHLHGVEHFVTGSDGGRRPRSQWRCETTELVGVGQTRDIEFIARAGDWAFHCHMTHHAMNSVGHSVPNLMGGTGSFGTVDMGGMFTVLKVRDHLEANDYNDPGWYDNPKGAVAHRVSDDPDFGEPPRAPRA